MMSREAPARLHSDRLARMVEQLGLVSALLSASPQRANTSMTYLAQWVKPAIAHRQIRFAFDEQGHPLAYWLWAHLTTEVLDRLRSPGHLLHECEWNEGEHVCVVDLVAPYGYVLGIVRHIRGTQFAELPVWQVRQDNGRIRMATASSERLAVIPPRTRYQLPAQSYAATRAEWLCTSDSRSA
ncbi:toxin-activating lysine-acyltransferase [Ralstonia pseudosolanacearum]|uniref:toxin-activating lysine-acyltransferase n=1 Tax=Ralstonia pseudosolanacearum TaxID=1310165 RepID=UPI00405387F4